MARDELRQAALASRAARQRLKAAVRQGRLDGLSWQQIADEIGTTRQSAWTRFHSVENE